MDGRRHQCMRGRELKRWEVAQAHFAALGSAQVQRAPPHDASARIAHVEQAQVVATERPRQDAVLQVPLVALGCEAVRLLGRRRRGGIAHEMTDFAFDRMDGARRICARRGLLELDEAVED